MNGRFNESFEEHKDMYVINLDLNRIFWLIAIGLFSVTFFFLFGYWLGNDTVESKSTNYRDFITSQQKIQNQNNSALGETVNTSGNPLQHQTLSREEMMSQVNNLTRNRLEERNSTAAPSTNRSGIDLGLENNEATANTLVSRDDPNKPYSIQVSIHKVKPNALRLREKLIEKGFNAYIHTKNRRGSELSFVRVGPFATEAEAQRTQHRLRSQVRAARNCLIIKK